MTPRPSWLVLVLALVLSVCVGAQTPQAGKNTVSIRGQQQEIYLYPGAGPGPHAKVLFACGDGGWHGFAVTIAEHLASAGYDAFGLDTRHYLQSFTGSKVLSTSNIAWDFAQMAQWIRQGNSERVLLVGWSEGAGLGLAAAAQPTSAAVFTGLLTIGTTEQNILAWRWTDIAAQIAKKLPNEPTFPSADMLGKVAPLPLFQITSTGDEYVTVDAARKLFASAGEPKRLVVIDARDHKFNGNTDEFFRTLVEGLKWIQQQQR